MGEQRVGVVGGGILGVAIAREVVRRRPGTEVVVLEKEDRLAAHQTGHNSGVVHAGIYYKPGSLKAELCTRGRGLLQDFCAEHAIAVRRLRQARRRRRRRRDGPLRRPRADGAPPTGCPACAGSSAEEIREVEPHAAGLAALHSPETAITDYPAITGALADEVVAAGGEVRLAPGSSTSGDRTAARRCRSRATRRRCAFDHVVVAAGLHADRVSALVDGEPEPGDPAVPRGVPRRRPRPSRTWCGAWSTRCRTRATRSSASTSPAGSTARSRSGPTPCSPPARGLPAPRRLGRRPARRAGLAGLLAAGPRPLAHGHRRGGRLRARSGPSCARRRATSPTSASPTCARRQRRTRPGRRPRRQPGRRLPDHPRRRGDVRAQRALARRDVEPGDRGSRRGPDVVVTVTP